MFSSSVWPDNNITLFCNQMFYKTQQEQTWLGGTLNATVFQLEGSFECMTPQEAKYITTKNLPQCY